MCAMSAKILSGAAKIPHRKELAENKQIEILEPPKKVYIPLRQHIGVPCKTIVEKGDRVRRGDKIGETDEGLSAPVHSSVDGVIEDIKPHSISTGDSLDTIIIDVEMDEESLTAANETLKLPSKEELESKTKEEIINAVNDSGIVGMGGAAFPSAVKLNPPPDKTLDTVILNGCECEPYLTCDHRLMVERAKELLAGAKLLMKAAGVESCYICIETNKKDAIKTLKSENNDSRIKIHELPDVYPMGAEKTLIYSVLGREVPSGGLPFDVGVLVQNVGTTVAIYEAVIHKKPLIERIVTVTGENLFKPKNLKVPIGTPVKHLIDQCGGIIDKPTKIVVGGPMTGLAQSDLDVPIMKGSNGVLVLKDEDTKGPTLENIYPCMRCGNCVISCPMNLYPNNLSNFIEDSQYEKAKEWDIFDCMLCGLCSFVCVARRPMVQLISQGREELTRRKKEGGEK